MKTKYLFLITLLVALIFLHSFAEAQLSEPKLNAKAESSSQIDLNWVDHNKKESGVEIQRLNPSTGQFQTIATVVKQEISYSDTGLNAGTTYSYRLMPFFKSEYIYSNIATAATLGGSTPPNAPSNLAATAVSSSQINLSWADNSNNETGFKIDRATSSTGPWSQIAIVGANTTSYQNIGLSASTPYYYHVHAYNTVGDSAACNTASATTQSGTADPDAPSNLTANAISSSQINLNWIDNSSNENGFEIERAPFSGGPWSNIATLGTNATSYSNTGLSSATTYYYRVCAYTIKNKWFTEYTAYSNTANATTQGATDTTPPPAPTGLSATPNTWTNINSFSINWTNPSDPSGIAGAYYKIVSIPTSNTDGTYTTSKPFTVSATAQGGQNIYVWLKDGANNTSYQNRSSTILYYDGTAPTNGTLSTNAGNAQVSLSWSGFSDNGGSGLKSANTYRVMRNTGTYPNSQCTSGTQIYLGTGSSTTDTGLTNGTSYYYRACAYDNAGNISTGAAASATPAGTTDTTPPTVPTNLTATAISSSQINLSWSPSYDTGGSGLAGYKVYRSVTQIGTTAATNYSDYGLAANTQYCYKVAAYDGAGNTSAQSAQACATTQAPQSGAWVSFPASGFVDSTTTLYAVWTADASHVWVATSRSDATAELLLWDGSTWSSKWSRANAMVRGIWGSGPNDVWAVGLCGLILHWNGYAWADVQNPASKTTIGSLNAVWGSGPYDVWAVGAVDPITAKTTMLHWNGTAWTSTILSGYTRMGSVWGSGPGDVWAVGAGGNIKHWNGTAWSDKRMDLSSQPNLRGIWGSGPYDVWAVGDQGNVLHWDGIAWSINVPPSITQPPLFAIWGSSSTNVWSVGNSLSMRLWDGNSWTSVPTPATSRFYSISGTNINNVWAVGASGTLLRYQP